MKKTHGGKRKGSGRKQKEETKVIRIPISKVTAVKAFLNNSLSLLPNSKIQEKDL